MATYPTVRPVHAAEVHAVLEVTEGCLIATSPEGIEFIPVFQGDTVTYTEGGLEAEDGLVPFGEPMVMGGAPPTPQSKYIEPTPDRDYTIPAACPRLPLVPVFGPTTVEAHEARIADG